MKIGVYLWTFILIVLCTDYTVTQQNDPGKFLIGAGIYDVTGQVAEIGFMGYAVPKQRGRGLLQRMRSRAFIIGDPNKEANRVVYVSVDNGMGFQIIKTEVVDRLNKTFGSKLYNDKNVLMSGTHTHSTPGGTGGTALVDITTFGFVKENWEACVNGIVQSIIRAHKNLQLGRIKMNVGQVDNANINRSPASYDNNMDKGEYPDNTDHEMTVLRFESIDGKEEIGMMNFYPVHAVSLNNTNLLVAGDNKGYASYLFEKSKNPPGTLPGQGKFIAAFGQSNEGDVSPNLMGPKCIDTGLPCDYATSTCNGRTEKCIAFGPGKNMYESNEIIGTRQFETAKNLYDNAQLFLNGNYMVDYRHSYVDMQTINVSSRFTSTKRNETTCQAALGYGFAAGTTDGPGDFDFTQSENSTNPFWQFVAGFLARPTQQQIRCQAPKPILLDVGLIKPVEWVPFVLPHQLFRIGQLYIVGVPGEFTTMSGRRLKLAIKQALQNTGAWTSDSHVVIAGLSNSYSHYITTYEEYQQQRYEGASTLYGPHTLAAYEQTFDDMATKLSLNQSVPSGPQPYDMRGKTFSFVLPPIWDGVPFGKKFGDVITDVNSSYKPGDTVRCSWWGANPRNDLFTEKSYLYVDRFMNQQWVPILTDDDIETRFLWERKGLDHSVITVEWNIPTTQPTGNDLYRIRHLGVKNNILGRQQYNAQSRNFTITN
ncbi:unnamed protein product [Adineta steineri]|uniref:Neutral ceramidase n=1 Tax=Adineta steineri TaxID=433720 RepID=A0A815JVL8_9BILA|nr:unnamed protein product [Adineta steineri]CAF1381700.1 unnamed protein product [Adineta steineri]